jgi:hypothetical protein
MPFVPSLQPPPSSLLPLPLSERTVYLLLPGRGLLWREVSIFWEKANACWLFSPSRMAESTRKQARCLYPKSIFFNISRSDQNLCSAQLVARPVIPALRGQGKRMQNSRSAWVRPWFWVWCSPGREKVRVPGLWLWSWLRAFPLL